jgi:hypothetical protein
MLHFVAPSCTHPNPAIKLAFALWIRPPDADADPAETIAAFVSPVLDSSRVSRELAHLFGARDEGEEISITIRQYSHGTLRVQQFGPISVHVRYAHERLGRDYIHLGIDDLAVYFELTLCEPKDPSQKEPFMLLQPHKQFAGMYQIL